MSSEQNTSFSQAFVAGICGALDETESQTRLTIAIGRNVSTNVLLAVMLNGFARHARGQSLSDLETRFVDAFTRAGFTNAELGVMGSRSQTLLRMSVADSFRHALLGYGRTTRTARPSCAPTCPS
jgi:hypothetical protein